MWAGLCQRDCVHCHRASGCGVVPGPELRLIGWGVRVRVDLSVRGGRAMAHKDHRGRGATSNSEISDGGVLLSYTAEADALHRWAGYRPVGGSLMASLARKYGVELRPGGHVRGEYESGLILLHR